MGGVRSERVRRMRTIPGGAVIRRKRQKINVAGSRRGQTFVCHKARRDDGEVRSRNRHGVQRHSSPADTVRPGAGS